MESHLHRLSCCEDQPKWVTYSYSKAFLRITISVMVDFRHYGRYSLIPLLFGKASQSQAGLGYLLQLEASSKTGILLLQCCLNLQEAFTATCRHNYLNLLII